MKRWAIAALVLAGCASGGNSPTPALISVLVQTWTATNGTLTMTASAAFGGAVVSLTDGTGNQYVNTADHGREWQTAYQLDGLTADENQAENPTEAGSASDTITSSSQIISASAVGNVFSTCVHPAYWIPYNGAVVSPDTICKTVTLGYSGISNLIRWDVSITTAAPHMTWTVEGVTGYGPELPDLYQQLDNGSFSEFDSAVIDLEGETQYALPIIEASADGMQAVGIKTFGTIGEDENAVIYTAAVDKWDCAWFTQTPIAAATTSYTCYIAVGTLADVEAAMTQVAKP